MTVSSTNTKRQFNGDGSTAAFAYNFKVFADADLQVIVRSSTGTESVKSSGTHYNASGIGETAGGTVTFTSGNIPASGETITLRRAKTVAQELDLVANDPFPAANLENQLDKLTHLILQNNEELDRALKLSRTNTMTSTEFTNSATDRANKVLSFDSSGELAVTQELGVYRGNWAASTAYNLRDLIKDTSAAGANSIYICVTAHTSSGSAPIATNTDAAKWSILVDRLTTAVTTTTSLTNDALVVGRDADNQVKFSTDNQIIFRVSGGDGVTFKASGEIEATSLDISGVTAIDGLTTFGAGFNVGSDASGDILYNDGSKYVRLAKGSDGQILTLASGVPSWSTESGDIAGVTAGVGLSGGGTSGTVSLALDLSELSDVTPANGDKLATLDSDGSTEQLTTIASLATLFAGTGLTASSSVIGVDASQTQITSVGNLDAGSITSGFGAINVGSSRITTTGFLDAGTLSLASATQDNNLIVESTNGGSARGPLLELRRSSSSPADDDILGQLKFTGHAEISSSTHDATYASIQAHIVDHEGNQSSTYSQGSLSITTYGSAANGNTSYDYLFKDNSLTIPHKTIIFEGETADAHKTSFVVTEPTGDRTLTFPDETGTIALLNQDTTGNAATATALATGRTIHGVSFDGTANIDLSEVIQDTVGAMASSNDETGITVTYQDGDGTLDFVIGAGAIVNSMLADDAVGADELASNAVVTASIVDDNVTQAKIADDAVGADQLASSAVVTASIVDDAVTQAKIADDAVGADQLASDAVVNASVASGAAIVDTKLATISTANKVALTALDIDGGTDIGAAIVDADLFIIDDGAGGTNKKVAASRIKTYISASTSPTAADDIGAGDAAVSIATSTGNITLDAQGDNTDIIFKGTDGGADTTFLTLSGANAGAASFNGVVTANAGVVVDNITIDGNTISSTDTNGNINLSPNGVGKVYITNDSYQSTLIIESTIDGTQTAPDLDLYKNSASPADGDYIGNITWNAENSNDDKHLYFQMLARSMDVTAGTEDGAMEMWSHTAGAAYERFTINPTEVVVNESSIISDFRVESNGDANCLFVDGTNNRVGIGTGSPSELLDVDGTLNTTNLKIGTAQGSDGQVLTSTGSGVAWEDAAGGGAMTLVGTATVGNNSTNAFSITSCFSTSYDNYTIVGHDVGKDTNGNTYTSDDMFMYIIDENGTNQDNGTYSWATQTTNGSAFSRTQGSTRWCSFAVSTRHIDRTNFFKMDIALHDASGQDKVTAVGRYMKSWSEPFIFNGAVLAVNTQTSNAYTATPSGLHFKMQTANSYFLNGMTLRIYGYNKS